MKPLVVGPKEIYALDLISQEYLPFVNPRSLEIVNGSKTMSRMKKILFAFIAIAIIVLGGYYYVFVYSKEHHRNVQSENAIIIQADSLSAAYQQNEKNANSLYLNKAVEVSGKILSIAKNQEGKTTLIIGSADAFSKIGRAHV